MAVTNRFGGVRKVNDQEYDKTQIRLSHLKTVHRDYIAHCVRWGWVPRQVIQSDRVLDVGCGQDAPLYKEIGNLGSFISDKSVDPKTRPTYTGVDMNKIKTKTSRKGQLLLGEFNFNERWQELDGPFSLITSLEVIEHMTVEHGREMLTAMRNVATDGGRLIISTPVFNHHNASNHIHEYGYEELIETLADCGWEVSDSFGLYGSWPKIKKVATPEEVELYEDLLRVYGHDMLAMLLAPKYPHASKAIMHVCYAV